METTSPHSVNLWNVAAEGDRDALARGLDQGLPVDAVDERGDSALHHAVRSGNGACVQLLLQRGAAPDLRNHLELMPIDEAVLYGDLGMTLDLQRHGADTKHLRWGKTLAWWARCVGHDFDVFFRDEYSPNRTTPPEPEPEPVGGARGLVFAGKKALDGDEIDSLFEEFMAYCRAQPRSRRERITDALIYILSFGVFGDIRINYRSAASLPPPNDTAVPKASTPDTSRPNPYYVGGVDFRWVNTKDTWSLSDVMQWCSTPLPSGDDWIKAFLRKYRPGDEIYFYSGGIEPLGLESGYLLCRGDQCITSVCVLRS